MPTTKIARERKRMTPVSGRNLGLTAVRIGRFRLALRKTTRTTCPRNRLYTAASITTKIEIRS
jgi:hypothetical protein